MKRRTFIRNSGLAASTFFIPGLFNAGCTGPKKQPNILFLFTDDQSFNTINALNNPEVKTPNMDRLVRQGLSFTRAYIMGGTSGAVCMPSRAMLLTGKSLFHLSNQGAAIPDDHVMFPELFRNRGYQTFGTGKWHNGRDAYARCFTDGGKIMFDGMSDHLKVPVYDFDPSGDYHPDHMYHGEAFSSEMFSDEAIRFLQNQKKDNPFLAYISYTAPHDPRMAPAEFSDMYPPESITVPSNFRPAHPFDNGELYIRDENLAPFPRTPEIVQEHIADYYAMITHLDYHIGRVLDTLEKTGQYENTIIIFAGDNGLAVGQHGLMGKQSLYDHSVRIPLIISGPGIPAGETSNALVYLNDIFPTLCNLADSPVPESVESKSFYHVLENPAEEHRDALFLAYTKLHRGVRTKEDWKLIKYNVRGKETTQLFNLQTDPWELENLAGDPVYAEKKETLTALLKKKMDYYDDFCDLDKPNWGLPEEKSEISTVEHLAVGKACILKNSAKIGYSTKGIGILTDGIRGPEDFRTGHWAGIEGENLDVVVDLGKPTTVSEIRIGFMSDQGAWIFLPETIEFSVSSDGSDFKKIKSFSSELKQHQIKQIKDFTAEGLSLNSRFIRIVAENIETCPRWHPGYGHKSWIFCDEIIIL